MGGARPTCQRPRHGGAAARAGRAGGRLSTRNVFFLPPPVPVLAAGSIHQTGAPVWWWGGRPAQNPKACRTVSGKKGQTVVSCPMAARSGRQLVDNVPAVLKIVAETINTSTP